MKAIDLMRLTCIVRIGKIIFRFFVLFVTAIIDKAVAEKLLRMAGWKPVCRRTDKSIKHNINGWNLREH